MGQANYGTIPEPELCSPAFCRYVFEPVVPKGEKKWFPSKPKECIIMVSLDFGGCVIMAREKERTKMGMLDQFKKLVPQGEDSEYGIMLFANFENEGCWPVHIWKISASKKRVISKSNVMSYVTRDTKM